MAQRKNVVFNAKEVAKHLEGLKTAAPGARWWVPALRFVWDDVRRASTSGWVSVSYTDQHGVTGGLVLRIMNEAHSGQIMPKSDKGLADLMARLKPNPKLQIKKRDKKPSIHVRRWDAKVKTLEDGITLVTDETGAPIYPDDSTRSDYFRVAVLLDEAFQTEAGERVERGKALVAAAKTALDAARKAGKPADVKAVLADFVSLHGPIRTDLVWISNDNAAEIRKLGGDAFLADVGIHRNVRIASLIQEFISNESSNHPGGRLPNPGTRIGLNFDDVTDLPVDLAFYDKSKPFTAEGKNKFDIGKVDGTPINAENVHNFILPGCRIDGIVRADSVCFSSMGISMPVKINVAVVAPPVSRAVGLDDLYGDDADSASAPASPATPPPGKAEDPGSPAPADNPDLKQLVESVSSPQ